MSGFEYGVQYEHDNGNTFISPQWTELAAHQDAVAARIEGVMALCDDIEDEYATICCNRGPSRPCTSECQRAARVLDRIRAALSKAPVPVDGCACGVTTEHGPHELDLPVDLTKLIDQGELAAAEVDARCGGCSDSAGFNPRPARVVRRPIGEWEPANPPEVSQ